MRYKRRFLVAVAFAGYPGVVFPDEPFSNVDIMAKAETMGGVISINREKNVSTVLVSHVFDNLSKIDSIFIRRRSRGQSSRKGDKTLQKD